MEPCPDASTWVDWMEGKDRTRWADHLSACPACRDELAALLKARPERRFRVLPYAAAAALLLAASALLWPRSQGTAPSSRPSPAPAPSLAEWAVGRTGALVLEPRSRGQLKGGEFLLEEGGIWLESAGDPVRLRVAGWDGLLELKDGAAAVRMPASSRSAFLLREAWAGVEPSISVVRGEVRLLQQAETRILRPIPGASASDPRGWRPLATGVWKDGERILLPSAPEAFTAEILIRKGDPRAEAVLLFRSEGKGWEAPLGVYLPNSGAWVRVRIETGPKGVRVGAGETEYFSGNPRDKAYPWQGSGAFGIRARGGDLEVREARWRP